MNIDEMMNRFRIASRETFNHFFRVSDPYNDNGWLLEERFAQVEAVLFQQLVIEPAALPLMKYGELQSSIGVALRDTEVAPAMLNRDIDSGYWDYGLQQITSDAQLKFVSFFDWDQLDYRDNRYVRVQITDWSSQPDAIGKQALIESQYAKFFKA